MYIKRKWIMKQTELLLPAGNIEKMQYAISYGADAVYFGVGDFSLRSMKSGNVITLENINEAISTAHAMGAKAYVTLNIFARNKDLTNLSPIIEKLSESKPDAVIFSDPGIFSILKKELPDVPFHVSTQANTLNYETVKFWQDLGATRVILARELSLKEIEEISSKVPDIELEVFVHGSLCVSYSGRCLLSDYMTKNERKSNQGACVQPCRWQYKLVEETRPGQYFDILEDSRGTYILNPKDIALIKYIPELINAGVKSFKVEGRTKSLYYASIVAKAYKSAFDACHQGKSISTDELLFELTKVGNRGFTSGFLMETPDQEHYNYITSKGVAGETFLATILEKVDDITYKLIAKNQIKVGDKVEWVTPTRQISSIITNIINLYDENVEIANTNEIIYLKTNEPLENWKWAILRSCSS